MKKGLSISILSAAFSLALSMPVFAGGWRQGDAGRWWYEKDTASETVYMNSWQKTVQEHGDLQQLLMITNIARMAGGGSLILVFRK